MPSISWFACKSVIFLKKKLNENNRGINYSQTRKNAKYSVNKQTSALHDLIANPKICWSTDIYPQHFNARKTHQENIIIWYSYIKSSAQTNSQENTKFAKGKEWQSKTRADFIVFDTLLTAHLATPVKFTLATLLPRRLLRRETPSAAHNFTSIRPAGGPVTGPALGAGRSWHVVALAEIRWRVQVDQVGIGVEFEVAIDRFETASRGSLADDHLGGAVEFLLQHVAHLSETRHGAPARLDLAGAGHAVTLARHVHVVLDGLSGREKKQCTVTCWNVYVSWNCGEQNCFGKMLCKITFALIFFPWSFPDLWCVGFFLWKMYLRQIAWIRAQNRGEYRQYLSSLHYCLPYVVRTA